MFYLFEKILGRPLKQSTQEGLFRIVLFLLLSLMIFTTFNDLKDWGYIDEDNQISVWDAEGEQTMDWDDELLDIFDIHISGPLAGCLSSKDKYVTRSKAADIEVRSLQNHETLTKGLKQLNVPATRRPLRFRPENLQWSWKGKDTLNISFSLRKGCYATSLLREVCVFS